MLADNGMLNDAYWRGYEAARLTRGIESNPFGYSPLKLVWAEGFYARQSEYFEERSGSC